jgi:hypothetical protein
MSRIDTHVLTTEIDAQVQRPDLRSKRCGVRDDADEIDGIFTAIPAKFQGQVATHARKEKHKI